jgi:chaperonin cofactor prefoldin
VVSIKTKTKVAELEHKLKFYEMEIKTLDHKLRESHLEILELRSKLDFYESK